MQAETKKLATLLKRGQLFLMGWLAGRAAAAYTEHLIPADGIHLRKERSMKPDTPTPNSQRRWLRKFWGVVCVIAGLASIAAGLETALLD